MRLCDRALPLNELDTEYWGTEAPKPTLPVCLAPSIDLSWFLETSLISDTAESTGKEERSGQENGSVMAGLTSTYYLKRRQAYRIIFGPKEMY